MDQLYIYFELFSFICCICFYRKLDKSFKIFLPYLSFIVIYEFANIYNLLLLHHTNAWCNSLEGILELLVFGYFIASLDKRKNYRKKAYLFVTAGILFSLIDFFFIQGVWELNTISFVLQNAIIAILVCLYYYNLMNNSDEYLDLLRYPPFYTTTGLLLYSLANFVYYSFFSYMVYKNNYHFYILVMVIPRMATFMLYTLLGISFICFSRTKKLS